MPSAFVMSACAQTGMKDKGAPTFRVPASELSKHVTVIAYGDQRFHNPSDTQPANPKMRKALVEKIAEERPDALLMSGDLPYKGTDPADYEEFRVESAPWRAEHLRLYPALGNHELNGGAQEGLEAWWKTFPELRGMHWYSVALGERLSLIQLDSTANLMPGSAQLTWVEAQLKALPKSVDFVMINLHHPPVADFQTRYQVDHNPRPNEIALRDVLSKMAPKMHARIVVIAGHIHNYERRPVDGVTYLVSGGGGAHPYEVDRAKEDMYQDTGFPVFHFVRFELEGAELKATMVKAADPEAKTISWEAKDRFVLTKK